MVEEGTVEEEEGEGSRQWHRSGLDGAKKPLWRLLRLCSASSDQSEPDLRADELSNGSQTCGRGQFSAERSTETGTPGRQRGTKRVTSP